MPNIKNTLSLNFFFRQLYRVLVIWPYEFFAFFTLKIVSLFRKNLSGDTVYFVVTSVIHPAPQGLTYSGTRSVFSSEQRAAQTLATVNSIRAKVPKAKIFLVESGREEKLPAELVSAVDTYLYVGRNKLIRAAVDSRFKSLGEVFMLLATRKHLPRDGKIYFKISGRYVLNEDFKPEAWETDKFKFHYVRNDFVSTRLYSFSGSKLNTWFDALWKTVPYLWLDYPIEFLLYKWVPILMQEKIDVAGVSGADATNGTLVKE